MNDQDFCISSMTAFASNIDKSNKSVEYDRVIDYLNEIINKLFQLCIYSKINNISTEDLPKYTRNIEHKLSSILQRTNFDRNVPYYIFTDCIKTINLIDFNESDHEYILRYSEAIRDLINNTIEEIGEIPADGIYLTIFEFFIVDKNKPFATIKISKN